MNKSYVWDWSTRLFHWALVILVSISMYTGFVGGFEEMDWHMLSGYGILALILFRIVWGIVGSRNARFASFVRGPGPVIDYVRNLRSSPPGVGHSPLAALSVVTILLSLLLQATTGLFANDDIFLEGPLTHLVSDDTSDFLTYVHDVNRWVLVGLIALHIMAIVFYQLIRRENLVMPMITGWKKGVDAPPAQNRWLTAVVTAAVVGGFVYVLVEYV